MDGQQWRDPIKLDYNWATGNHTSIEYISGNPAIAYLDEMFDRLVYTRSLDESGASWGEPIIVYERDLDDAGAYADLEVVGGAPAIAYHNRITKNLLFVTAQDALGEAWNDPEVVDENGNVGNYLTFEVINGAPAIAYFDTGERDLRYAVWY